jgi:hypothetical protein
MRAGNFLKLSVRILAWGAGFLVLIALIWFTANRLFDAHLDPRLDAFLHSADSVPDAKNMAIGIAGLGAPRGTDFMKFGAEIKKLHEHAAWPDIRRKFHGPDELKLTVESARIDCWIDPDWPGSKDCLPFENVPQVLAENREILERYKALYKLGRYVSVGQPFSDLIPLTKLAVAEMRLDMRNGNYEAAYAKWRDQFRFTGNYLRGQDDWVGKAVGLVDLGMSFSVIESLLVKQPSLARAHFDELLQLLQPEGIEMINPVALAREQNARLDYFFKSSYSPNPEFEDTIDRLAWKLGQPNRVRNRYFAYSEDLVTVLRQPWAEMSSHLARTIDQHTSFGWEYLIDPFGSLAVLNSIQWQSKLRTILRQIYISGGKLRLATLVVRATHDKVRDEDIPVFLANAERGLYDPFSEKPMQWDARNGRIYFLSGDDQCSIAAFRVPVWDAKSKRRPPKEVAWSIC